MYSRTVSYHTTGKKYTREWLFFDDYVRVRLVVFEVYIKAGLVVLYERVFQQEGVMLGSCDRKIYSMISDTSLRVLKLSSVLLK